MDERLPPRVQDGDKADLGAQMPGVGRDGLERLRHRAEQDPIDEGLVVEGDGRDRGRQGEDHVEVFAVEQVGLASLDPRGTGQALALRAMAIATGVVPDPPVPTVVALLEMAAERGGATLLDRGHRWAVDRAAPTWCRKASP